MSNSKRVSVFEVTSEINPAMKPDKVLKVLLGFIFAINIGCTVYLIDLRDGWDSRNFYIIDWRIESLNKLFYERATDCLWIAIIEAILFPLVAYAAIKAGKLPDDLEEIDNESKAKTCDCFRCYYGVTRLLLDRKQGEMSPRRRTKRGKYRPTNQSPTNKQNK